MYSTNPLLKQISTLNIDYSYLQSVGSTLKQQFDINLSI